MSELPPPHVIRLREPWHLESNDGDAESKRNLVFHRGFNRPTGLDTATQVHLAVAGRNGRGQVFLNGQRLGSWNAGSTSRFEILNELSDFNRLQIDVDPSDNHESQSGRLALVQFVSEVRIEIR
jgi:hypothetical protein